MKKIEDFTNRHEMGVLLSGIALAIVIAIALAVLELGFYFVVAFIIIGYIWMGYEFHKDRKARRKAKKGWSISELKDFYAEPFNAVNQTIAEHSYSVVNDHNWLFTFNKTVRDLLLTINNSRRFSSFEFASCLIYSLIVDPVVKFDDNSKQLLFAFSCAKKLISKPTFYQANTTFPGKELLSLEISSDAAYEEVKFDFPNEDFSEKAICKIITAYTSSGKSEDLLQFSDLLQKMYSMSCNK